MPDSNGNRKDWVLVSRVLEYWGPVEWIEKTLTNSRVPMQGQLTTGSGAYIKSGMIVWEREPKQPEEEPPKSVNLPRPGGG